MTRGFEGKRFLLCLLLLLLLLFFVGSGVSAEDMVIGEDGRPVEAGMKITSGIGYIGSISFSEGWVIIGDARFEFGEDLILKHNNEENVSESIFVEGVRVVWKVQGRDTLLSMDYYPVESTENVADNTEDSRDDGKPSPAASSGGSVITKDADGVYRN